jgi:hypothetical protein
MQKLLTIKFIHLFLAAITFNNLNAFVKIKPLRFFNSSNSCGSRTSFPNFPSNCGLPIIQPTIDGSILKIINAQNSRESSWPWLVYLGQATYNKTIIYKCSATLISINFILTTASCLNGLNSADLIAIIGIGKITLNIDINKLYNISSIYYNGSYDSNNKYYSPNIALLKLSRSVLFDNSTQPICLPLSNNDLVVSNKMVVLASWYFLL